MLRVSEDESSRRECYLANYKQLRNSLLDLQNAADRIFDVISERTAQESQKLTDLSRRIQVAKARIDDIAHSKKDIVIKSPSNYPSHSKDDEDFKPLFGYNESGVGFPVAELLVNGGLSRDCGEDGTLELFQFFSETRCDFPNKVLEQAPSMSTNSSRNKSIEDVLGLPNFIYNSLLKEVNADMDSSIETKEQSLPPPPPSLLDSMRVKSRNIPK